MQGGQTRIKKCASATCPFNNSHIMPAQTLQAHILKCSFKTKQFVQCIHNPIHWIKRNFIEEHQRKCDNNVTNDDDDDDWACIGAQIKQKQKETRLQKKLENNKNKQTVVNQKERKKYKEVTMKDQYNQKKNNTSNVQNFLDEKDQTPKKQSNISNFCQQQQSDKDKKQTKQTKQTKQIKQDKNRFQQW